jgi:hypothetical protein
VDISDPAAVARLDRTRAGRRTSNREWHNPDDPDARVGTMKSGACDTIYMPKHVVDMESGVVTSAEIRHGDEGDTAGLADRVAEAAGKVEAIHGEEHDAGSSRVPELAADRATARAVATRSGETLLRARGTHLGRGFAHARERFLKRRRGRVFIVLDNNPVDVSKVDIRLAKRSGGRIRLEHSPAYAPKLNPQAQASRYAKRTGTSGTPLRERQRCSAVAVYEPHFMQNASCLIRIFFAQPDSDDDY